MIINEDEINEVNKNLDELMEKFGKIERISNNVGVIEESGKKIFLNDRGEQSGRLATFPIKKIFRNGRYFYEKLGSCFLNVNRRVIAKGDGVIKQTHLQMSLYDRGTKSGYYIEIPMGKLMILLRLRDFLPGVKDTFNDSNHIFKKALDEDLQDLIITDYFKSLFNGDENIVEHFVSRHLIRRKDTHLGRNHKKKKLNAIVETNSLSKEDDERQIAVNRAKEFYDNLNKNKEDRNKEPIDFDGVFNE